MKKRYLLLILALLPVVTLLGISMYYIVRGPALGRFSISWTIFLAGIITCILIASFVLIKELLIPVREIREYLKGKTRYQSYSVLRIFEDLTEEIERLRREDLERKEEFKEFTYLRGLSESIIYNFPNYLIIMDSEKNILFINRNVIDWLGREVKDIVGHTFEEVLPQEILGEGSLRSLWEKVSRGGATRTTVDISLYILGRLDKVYNIYLSPIRIEERTLFLLMINDITLSRKRELQIYDFRSVSEFIRGVSRTDFERLLFAIMTGITSGDGAGFNRAFLLLAEDERGEFRGRFGLGPRSREEAYTIWGDIASQHKDMTELLHNYDRVEDKESLLLSDYAQRIAVPYSRDQDIVMQTVREKKCFVVNDARTDDRVAQEFNDVYQANSFISVPIVVRDKVYGIILADNIYTNEPIDMDRVQLINIFGLLCGLVIENSQAFQELGQRMEELKKAYSDLKEAHDDLSEKEKFAAMGRMAAVVSHEIRNPLVTIGGFARLIKRKCSGLGPVEQNAEIIIEEVERLESILANIMDYTKPLSPVLRNENLNEILHETVRMFRRAVKVKKIKLKEEFGRKIPEVALDRRQIKQVFINILKNAIESVEEEGTVTISTYCRDDHLFVEFRDDGVGIDQYTKENMFNPFFTTKEGGVGLGLSICKRIIDSHKGEIEVVSGPSQGSTFKIKLPIDQKGGSGDVQDSDS
ncbi:MAG: PAS domain-containing protein [Deltaproteobacteria bacterium]|nr:MAG: PAS domain-containing protein [Deltaproteobacteria bacterium]